MNNPDALVQLRRRGLLEQVTDEDGLKKLMDEESVTVYAGFDPTALSLQVGNLVPLLCLSRLQRLGHRPIILVGGATGMIGDPSGKSDERNLLSDEEMQRNVAAFRRQLERFVDFDGPAPAMLVNNLDWFKAISLIDWLRDVGKHFSVNAMIAKESVRARIENREQGISYTEFSYMMLQGYDFYHLNKEYGCRLQIGGSDQWGNITAGIDLIRRLGGQPAFGFTMPLVLTASGEKLGKSAGNSVWLDPLMTSPFAFYQYWIRTEDADVIRFIQFFTNRTEDEIQKLTEQVKNEPHKRAAQKTLAEDLVLLVHGQEGLSKALTATDVLYGGSIKNLTDAELTEIFADVDSLALPKARLAEGIKLVDLAAESGLFKSKGEARRRIEQGGVYVNNQRQSDQDRLLGQKDLASESVLVLRAGKKNYLLVRFE